jgi:hypothetical protein
MHQKEKHKREFGACWVEKTKFNRFIIVHDKTNNLLKFKDVLKWKDIVEN